MVGPRRRKAGKRPLLGNHQRCWLWGRHLVMETLKAGRWPVIELRLSHELAGQQREIVSQLAGDAGIPVVQEHAKRLTQLCGSTDHQGLLARMRPFPYQPVEHLFTRAGRCPALVMLDRIHDPHNFGAIIRAAEVQGIDGLIVGTHQQSGVTAAVARSSAGAVNYLPIAQVSSLSHCKRQLSERGVRVVVADAVATRSVAECDLTHSTLLLLGNENTGVSADLREMCDDIVRIPQSGHVESLNVAVAAGILFYELQRQRRATN